MQGGSIMSTRASIRPWGASMCGRLSRWCMKAYGGGGRMIRCRTRAPGWRSWLGVWGGVVWLWLVLIKDFFATESTEGHGKKIQEKVFFVSPSVFFRGFRGKNKKKGLKNAQGRRAYLQDSQLRFRGIPSPRLRFPGVGVSASTDL